MLMALSCGASTALSAEKNSRPSPVEVAQSQNNQEEEIKRIVAQCFDNYNAKRYAAALEPCKFTLKLLQAARQQKAEGYMLWMLGDIYSELSQPSNAIAAYEQALPIFKALEMKPMEAITLMRLGNIYYAQKNFPVASKYYEQALPLWRALKNQKWEAEALMILGATSLQTSQYAKAINYLEQALPILRAIKDQQGVEAATRGIEFAKQKLAQSK
jgi:tetratricopeptide (TPR) repeat protein